MTEDEWVDPMYQWFDPFAAREAVSVHQQAVLELYMAHERGPGWYTHGERGMWGYIHDWTERARASAATLTASPSFNPKPGG